MQKQSVYSLKAQTPVFKRCKSINT